MSGHGMFPEGYSCLVFGAGSGIGESAARLLAARGVRVIAVDRDEAAVAAVARDLVDGGLEAIAVAADVTDEASVRSAVELAVARFGAIHAVVNSAGVQGPLGVRSHEVDVADFERVLRVNVTAGLVIARAVIPHMLERGYGRIAHVASIAGKEGNPNMLAYSASKAAMIGLVKAQGKEYARDGITVNALAPAVIRTPFLDTQPDDVVSYMLEKIPMGRTGELREVAEMLAFMVSPACGFTTGFTFDASGGRATY